MVSIRTTIIPAIIIGVGLNPYRSMRRRRSDYVFVAAGLLVAVALVLWALLG
jgi:hypothetical protein